MSDLENRRVLDAIREACGGELRFNTYTQRVELNGNPIKRIETFYLHLAEAYMIQVPQRATVKALLHIAKESLYSPIVADMERCLEEHGGDTKILDNLASKYFGVDLPAYQFVLRKWLISAVARAYSPGCKAAPALVLQGPSGIGKSSFFSTLAGEYFDDGLWNINNNDERMHLVASWILEWAKIGYALELDDEKKQKKEWAAIRPILSSRFDLLRIPYYARCYESVPRQSVFCGSHIESPCYRDQDSSFWEIPVKRGIDIKELEGDRDKIWAAATAAYKKGESLWSE